MARYRFSIDLGVFLGMRHITVPLGEGGKNIQGIFIPTGINGIDVREDNRPDGKCNQSKLRAFVNFQQRDYASAYLSSVRDRLTAKGEAITPYNVPAWQVCYTLPEERRTVIRGVLKQVVLKAHPEWSQQEDSKGTELAAAISILMPFQMGDSYLIDDGNGQQSQSYSSAPSAQQVSGYTPVAAPPADQSGWDAPTSMDDLPF